MISDTECLLLVVDDDPEDFLLVKTAVKRALLPLSVKGLSNGDALMNYLAERTRAPDPLAPTMVILLDLNMPGKDGRSCLRDIKANPSLADIPVIVFSTSESPDDIQKSYALNANSYICKPDDLSKLENIVSTLYRYWFGHSLSPSQEPAP